MSSRRGFLGFIAYGTSKKEGRKGERKGEVFDDILNLKGSKRKTNQEMGASCFDSP